MSNSWKPELLIDGKWTGNGLRFVTKDEARRKASNTFQNWFASNVTDSRAAESEDAANYAYSDEGELVSLAEQVALDARLAAGRAAQAALFADMAAAAG